MAEVVERPERLRDAGPSQGGLEVALTDRSGVEGLPGERMAEHEVAIAPVQRHAPEGGECLLGPRTDLDHASGGPALRSGEPPTDEGLSYLDLPFQEVNGAPPERQKLPTAQGRAEVHNYQGPHEEPPHSFVLVRLPFLLVERGQVLRDLGLGDDMNLGLISPRFGYSQRPRAR